MVYLRLKKYLIYTVPLPYKHLCTSASDWQYLFYRVYADNVDNELALTRTSTLRDQTITSPDQARESCRRLWIKHWVDSNSTSRDHRRINETPMRVAESAWERGHAIESESKFRPLTLVWPGLLKGWNKQLSRMRLTHQWYFLTISRPISSTAETGIWRSGFNCGTIRGKHAEGWSKLWGITYIPASRHFQVVKTDIHLDIRCFN